MPNYRIIRSLPTPRLDSQNFRRSAIPDYIVRNNADSCTHERHYTPFCASSSAIPHLGVYFAVSFTDTVFITTV